MNKEVKDAIIKNALKWMNDWPIDFSCYNKGVLNEFDDEVEYSVVWSPRKEFSQYEDIMLSRIYADDNGDILQAGTNSGILVT